MSKFFVIALLAALTALATANVVVPGDRTLLRDQDQQRLQDGSCQTVCEGTGSNADCPRYPDQTQTGTSCRWAGPEDDWGLFLWQYFGWWE
jgi:hypothetical protein